MRKYLFLLLVTVLLLAACNSPELSIQEVESIPSKVQDRINPDYTLQLINDSEKGDAYIIFQSEGTVTAELKLNENRLDIMLERTDQDNSSLKQNVYKITRGDAEYDTINVFVNGQSTPLDNVTGF